MVSKNWLANQSEVFGQQISSIKYGLQDLKQNREEEPRQKDETPKLSAKRRLCRKKKTLEKEVSKFQSSKILWTAPRPEKLHVN